MRACNLLYTLITGFIIVVNSVYAAEINIKLRKTDISELKQQLIPAFEQNIQILNQLLLCLKKVHQTDRCLQQLNLLAGHNDNKEHNERQQQIKQELEQKLNEKQLSNKQIIRELEQLLLEAEKVKQCLHLGQTANELKNCIIEYKRTETP